jgi:uncharacterized protein YqjF (DUF2071 family)
MDNSLERLVRAQQRPTRCAVMHQRWDDLLFLHWRCDQRTITQRLPKGLSIDLFNGDAYISIIAFCMNNVRPKGLPALPWLSYFCELNVRVYVKDSAGEPGVFFLSLDCNRIPAVWVARAVFSLPYQHAEMRYDTKQDSKHAQNSVHTMLCRRRYQTQMAEYTWSAPSDVAPLRPGSLEFFLTERYNFFTVHRGGLMRGQVHHRPYQVSTPLIQSWSELPLAWDSFPVSKRPPELTSYSPGVSIEAFSLVPAG